MTKTRTSSNQWIWFTIQLLFTFKYRKYRWQLVFCSDDLLFLIVYTYWLCVISTLMPPKNLLVLLRFCLVLLSVLSKRSPIICLPAKQFFSSFDIFKTHFWFWLIKGDYKWVSFVFCITDYSKQNSAMKKCPLLNGKFLLLTPSNHNWHASGPIPSLGFAAKFCSNSQKINFNSSTDPKVSKSFKYTRVNFRAIVKKW